MYISPVHQRRTKSVFGIIAAVIFLLGLVGCERQTNDALEEYHNEDYGFSISVDKELMEYYGCLDITEMPLKVFLRTDEYQHVVRMVMRVLGLSKEVNDDEELDDAKN